MIDYVINSFFAGEEIFNTLQMNSKAKNKPKRLKIL